VRTVTARKDGRKIYESTSWIKEGVMDTLYQYYSSGEIEYLYLTMNERPKYLKGFYKNGVLKKFGDSLGLEKEEWYENGNRKSFLLWKDGQVIERREWHENGNKKLISQWREDKLHGIWKEWDETGNVTRNEKYQNGKLN
jgi:antitoxin component YwqK of YwqJK toxin-antitoxin module